MSKKDILTKFIGELIDRGYIICDWNIKEGYNDYISCSSPLFNSNFSLYCPHTIIDNIKDFFSKIIAYRISINQLRLEYDSCIYPKNSSFYSITNGNEYYHDMDGNLLFFTDLNSTYDFLLNNIYPPKNVYLNNVA